MRAAHAAKPEFPRHRCVPKDRPWLCSRLPDPSCAPGDIEPQEASRLIGRYFIAYMIRARWFQWSVALLALLALAVVLMSTWSLSRDTTATAMGHQVLVPRWWTVDTTDLGVEERPPVWARR